jgi:hypothetical protein
MGMKLDLHIKGLSRSWGDRTEGAGEDIGTYRGVTKGWRKLDNEELQHLYSVLLGRSL